MRFRFETLLRVRKNQENLIQRMMGTMQTHLMDQQQRLESMDAATVKNKKEYNAALSRGPDVSMLGVYTGYFKSGLIHRAQQVKVVAEVAAKAEAKRGELALAMQKRRMFELLKERQILAEKKEQFRQETAFLDEVAGMRWRGDRS
ncbi:MAG: flagellar export protein FliJ [Nitrospinaceae bacterium]